MLDRFLAFVDINVSGCWLWRGGTNKLGYPNFWADGRTQGAHRISYQLFVGPITEGCVLDHRCRTPACVNPAHLEPVTQRTNLLRGSTFQARNAAKTHCPQGHPYDAANTCRSGGRRHCLACSAERKRQRRREAAA